VAWRGMPPSVIIKAVIRRCRGPTAKTNQPTAGGTVRAGHRCGAATFAASTCHRRIGSRSGILGRCWFPLPSFPSTRVCGPPHLTCLI
jgi:hypothetical protein